MVTPGAVPVGEMVSGGATVVVVSKVELGVQLDVVVVVGVVVDDAVAVDVVILGDVVDEGVPPPAATGQLDEAVDDHPDQDDHQYAPYRQHPWLQIPR